MKRIVTLFALLFATSALANDDSPFAHWYVGTIKGGYTARVDRAQVHGGKASASLTAGPAGVGRFGTIMQSFRPGAYAGQRIRFSGWVKSEKVGDWAGLWMRVDGHASEVLGFDNMQDRSIKGTTEWTKYAIVLDVPVNATNIAYGMLLSGATGTVWIDDFSIEVVDSTVPTTAMTSEAGLDAPTNDGFEE